MVTAHDVARVAGVSQATVSRVLYGTTPVAEATRTRVLAALAETGYQPNVAARTMRTRRTGTIGLVVDDVTNPFYPELIRHLSGVLAGRDLRMILWDSAGPGERAAIEAIDQRLIDGLVFTAALPESAALTQATRRGAPVVLVNRTVRGLACDQVDGDNYDCADRLAAYLAANGHRRVAFIDGPPEASTAADRGAGFVAGCAAHGLELRPQWRVNAHFSHDGAATAVAGILAGTGEAERPTAYFCANDLTAFGTLDELRRRGLRVPEDAWVIGYDDIPMAGWPSFDLSTVRQPLADMAVAAIDLLLRRIENPDAPMTHRRFPNDFIPRGSTGHRPMAVPR